MRFVAAFRPLWEQPYAITTALTGVLAGALALLVLWRNPHALAARCWAALCGCVAGWALFNTFSLLSRTEADSLRYLRWADAVALLTPVTLLHFAMAFSGRTRRGALRAAYAAAGLILLTVWTPWFLQSGQWKFGIWFERGGPMFAAFAVLFVVTPAYGIHLLLQAARTAAGLRRAQLLCLAMAGTVGFSGGFMWFLPALGIDIPPIGGHWIAVYCLLAMYAIVRYQFLDLRLAVRRSVVYSLLVTGLTVAYFTLSYAGEHYFQHAVGYQSLPWSIAMFALIALIFQPVKTRLQRWVDRWLLPESPEASLRRVMAEAVHDLRSPLTALRTYMTYLPERSADGSFMTQFQAVVGQEMVRLERLTADLLDYAKPPRAHQPVSVRDLWESVIAVERPHLMSRAIAVTTQFQHNGAVVMGDAGRLTRAFQNLIVNARDAVPTGGKITVMTRTVPGAIEITVADTGPGIPAEHLPRLFDPFFTTKPHGTGLGLAIVQRIIHDHGGTVAVVSPRLPGTVFTIRLPAEAIP